VSDAPSDQGGFRSKKKKYNDENCPQFWSMVSGALS